MIHEESQIRQIPCERYCFNELASEFSLTNRETLVIVVSSTGDGEMPDNGHTFYK